MLEQGVAPWQKPWQGVGIPINPTTEKAYRGGNAVHLLATAIQRGYEDPRWMTYKQAAENDWQIKKSEKGTRIEFWEVKQQPDAKMNPISPAASSRGNATDALSIASTPLQCQADRGHPTAHFKRANRI